MGQNDYTKKDAAEETDTGTKNVSRAWHDAREDAQQSDHPIDKGLTEGWDRTPDTPLPDSQPSSGSTPQNED